MQVKDDEIVISVLIVDSYSIYVVETYEDKAIMGIVVAIVGQNFVRVVNVAVVSTFVIKEIGRYETVKTKIRGHFEHVYAFTEDVLEN